MRSDGEFEADSAQGASRSGCPGTRRYSLSHLKHGSQSPVRFLMPFSFWPPLLALFVSLSNSLSFLFILLAFLFCLPVCARAAKSSLLSEITSAFAAVRTSCRVAPPPGQVGVHLSGNCGESQVPLDAGRHQRFLRSGKGGIPHAQYRYAGFWMSPAHSHLRFRCAAK